MKKIYYLTLPIVGFIFLVGLLIYDSIVYNGNMEQINNIIPEHRSYPRNKDGVPIIPIVGPTRINNLEMCAARNYQYNKLMDRLVEEKTKNPPTNRPLANQYCRGNIYNYEENCPVFARFPNRGLINCDHPCTEYGQACLPDSFRE